LDEDVEESGLETDFEEDTGMDAEGQKFEMDIAKVYEQTIMQLGQCLDGNSGFGVVS
jgi:Subunit 11 of the general transcription factor TFIIH